MDVDISFASRVSNMTNAYYAALITVPKVAINGLSTSLE